MICRFVSISVVPILMPYNWFLGLFLIWSWVLSWIPSIIMLVHWCVVWAFLIPLSFEFLYFFDPFPFRQLSRFVNLHLDGKGEVLVCLWKRLKSFLPAGYLNQFTQLLLSLFFIYIGVFMHLIRNWEHELQYVTNNMKSVT